MRPSSVNSRRRGGGPSGGIQKRKSTGRVDRDGDLDMGVQASTGPKARPVNGPKVDKPKHQGKPGSGNGSVRGGSRLLRSNNRAPVGTVRGLDQPTGGFIELKISGWKEVNRPYTDAVAILERKSGTKFRRSRVVGDLLMVQVPFSKVPVVLEWDNISFHNGHLRVQPVSELPAGLAATIRTPEPERSEDAQKTVQLLQNLLRSRYNAETKFLDLSSLGADPLLLNVGFFTQASTSSKMFPALMKVADEQFKSLAEKREKVHSVTLAGNTLPDLGMVTSLAVTFPELKNLSLENNNIQTWKQMDPWRMKFRKLEQLVLTGNPIAQLPGYREEARKIWKSLIMLDNVPYPEPPAAPKYDDNGVPQPFQNLPLRVGPGIVHDSANTNAFLSQFFPLYDKDRKACLDAYYDANSTFTLSINTSSPRLATGKNALQKWDEYIPRSRNLNKIHSAKMIRERRYRGIPEISKIWESMPTTIHDVTDPTKWCYDSKNIPFEDTICMWMTIHGEFTEPDNIAKENVASKRSFTRTLIVLPGNTEGAYRVARDVLSIRAYGGSHAWGPNAEISPEAAAQKEHARRASIANQIAQNTGAPNIVTPQLAAPTDLRQQMLLELMKQTGLTEQFATMCLEQTGWVYEQAVQAFQKVKAEGTLPPEALQPVALA